MKRSSHFVFILLIWASMPACKQETKPVESIKENNTPTVDLQFDQQNILGMEYGTFQLDGIHWLSKNMTLETGDSWCYDNKKDCGELGRLYNWTSAMDACKSLGEGWRLPTLEEWKKLATQFGGYYDFLEDKENGQSKQANRALIKGGSSLVNIPLAGWRGSNGGFESADRSGYYWTATDRDEIDAWCLVFAPDGGKLTVRPADKEMGFSCRCVRTIGK